MRTVLLGNEPEAAVVFVMQALEVRPVFRLRMRHGCPWKITGEGRASISI